MAETASRFEEEDWESETVQESIEGKLAQEIVAMRLVPPPPSQDGGSYLETTDDHIYTSTTKNICKVDGNLHKQNDFDPVLMSCLENPRERLTLLKFEDQIVRFIKNSREENLQFPPLSSYHRLIIHRLAQRCYLEHQTADYNPYMNGSMYDGTSARPVTLYRTPQTQLPSVLLIDLSSERQTATRTPATAPKIMMRKRNKPGRNATDEDQKTGDGKNARTMQDREKAYAEARARIFGEDIKSDSGPTHSSRPNVSTSDNPVSMRSRQALGPDDTKGFKQQSIEMEEMYISATKNDQTGSDSSPINRRDPGGVSSTGTRASNNTDSNRSQNWKEVKVQWRNPAQERNDPDFTRHHGLTADSYRRLPSHQTNEYNIGSSGRYSSSSRYTDYYDNKRPNSGIGSYGSNVYPNSAPHIGARRSTFHSNGSISSGENVGGNLHINRNYDIIEQNRSTYRHSNPNYATQATTSNRNGNQRDSMQSLYRYETGNRNISNPPSNIHIAPSLNSTGNGYNEEFPPLR